MKDIVRQFAKQDQEGKVSRSMQDFLFTWILQRVWLVWITF